MKAEITAINFTETLVGYFDIYGYSSFIKGGLNECLPIVSKLFERVSNDAQAHLLDWRLKHWVFSDSIILVPDLDSHKLDSTSIDFFIGACAGLLYRCISNGLPLRGAIGGGYFYKNADILLSNALVDAHKYEQAQKWWGTVITPSALCLIHNYVPESTFGTSKGSLNSFRYIRNGVIPWKEDEHMPKKICINKQSDFFYLISAIQSEKWTASLPKYLDLDSEKMKDMIKESHRIYGYVA